MASLCGDARGAPTCTSAAVDTSIGAGSVPSRDGGVSGTRKAFAFSGCSPPGSCLQTPMASASGCSSRGGTDCIGAAVPPAAPRVPSAESAPSTGAGAVLEKLPPICSENSCRCSCPTSATGGTACRSCPARQVSGCRGDRLTCAISDREVASDTLMAPGSLRPARPPMSAAVAAPAPKASLCELCRPTSSSSVLICWGAATDCSLTFTAWLWVRAAFTGEEPDVGDARLLGLLLAGVPRMTRIICDGFGLLPGTSGSRAWRRMSHVNLASSMSVFASLIRTSPPSFSSTS